MIEDLIPSVVEPFLPIAEQFAHQGAITGLKRFGNGNINDTFLVTLDDPSQTCFVLQRINTRVFHNPRHVMSNMVTLTEHIHQKLTQEPVAPGSVRRWEMPRVVMTKAHQDHWSSGNGDYWRAISYIEGSESFDTLQTPTQAEEVGYALGRFHHLLCDLAPDRLVDTLPGFHITPQYLSQYQRVLSQVESLGSKPHSLEIQHCLDFIGDRQTWCAVLENAKQKRKLPLRLTHGDPKVNNIMFDRTSGKAVSIVDLDTAKPGLIHYDLGDCLRSGCNLLGEETDNWQAVTFEPELCQAILKGYLTQASQFFTEHDYFYLIDAARVIAFELGLRFFTDYLAGNVYFKTKYPEHNLARALVQFQLTASIEAQTQTLAALIGDLQKVKKDD